MDAPYSFDPCFLELPYARRHVRSSSKSSSIYSAVSTVESTSDSVCTRLTTPPRASPPVLQHGPILLPKIRHQDQQIDPCQAPAVAKTEKRAKSAGRRDTTPVSSAVSKPKPFRQSHARSYTNPETLHSMAYAHLQSMTGGHTLEDNPAPLLSSPAPFHDDTMSAEPEYMVPSRRASTCYGVDAATITKYGYPTYRHMPLMGANVGAATSASGTPQPEFPFASVYYETRSESPLSVDESIQQLSVTAPPSTTLINYLMAHNPAASLVHTTPFTMRDPNIKHFWWDIRNIRSWSSFNAKTIFALPGASALLTTPVPLSLLPQTGMASRHPETESSLHNIYASYYIPKVNAALALSSTQPLQFTVPKTKLPLGGSGNDLLFVANAAGEMATAATIFGGNPCARVVGLVRSFDRFNTGMRVEGNVKRVEYLRGLAALHCAMREHSCRYGFIITEIELVLVRAGTEATPFFGDLEITSVQLNITSGHASAMGDQEDDDFSGSASTMTACLALWGLCQIAGNDTPRGHARWRAEIGAPAEGTRRKAKPRDSWMPQPQLAEKRAAKRSRGWVWPEDAIGRKELGKRGVKYAAV